MALDGTVPTGENAARMRGGQKRKLTLHRLVGVDGIADVHRLVADVFALRRPARETGPSTGQGITVGGQPAVWFWAQDDDRPDWLDDVRVTVGAPVELRQQQCGVLVALEVDGHVYCVTYGDAWRWIGKEHREPDFGLRAVLRSLDPAKIRAVRSRRFGHGRTDSTSVAGGAPLEAVRPLEQLDVVRRLAGEAALTPDGDQREGSRGELLEGGDGLRLILGVRGDDIVAGIRRIIEILDREVPEELRAIESVRPAEPARTGALNAWLDRVLSAGAADDLALAWPDHVQDRMPEVRRFGYLRSRKGPITALEDLTLAHLLAEARGTRQRPGGGLARLQRHKVYVYDADSSAPRLPTSALHWLEADHVLDDVPHYLIEGRWFVVDAAYATSVRADVRRAFDDARPLGLPSWRRAGETENPRGKPVDSPEDEGTYNVHAAERAGLLCLDRKLVIDGLYARTGVELCDLLAPGGVYVHVKRASGSSELNHLFEQGAAAVLALWNQPGTAARFRERVVEAARAKGVDAARYLPDDLRPRRLVFAILKDGEPLTPETLYPMAAATLQHVMRRFESWQIEVEVQALTLGPSPLLRVA